MYPSLELSGEGYEFSKNVKMKFIENIEYLCYNVDKFMKVKNNIKKNKGMI